MIFAAWVFFLSLAACAYVYFGYPLLLLVLARTRPRPVRGARVHPRLTVVVPAHNEGEVIAAKVRSTLANGYPADRLEVLVASDGSSDETVARARAAGDGRVRVLDLPRRGKVPTLNAAARQATGEVLVFTDADVFLEPGVLARVAESFADPEVGGVAGRKVQSPDGVGHVARGEGLYTRYDEWQKGLESTIGSAVASHGALHALRRSLYVPVTDPTAADDMAISMRVVLQGYRLVYDPRAVVRVEAPGAAGTEIRRKVRIANQVMRALFGLGPALWTSGFYSVQLLSHKLLRYMVPFFLVLMLASSAWLAARGAGPFWSVMLALQGAFYGAALAGAALRGSAMGRLRVLTVPYYFSLVNAAALLAVVSVLRGQRASAWSPRGGFNPDPT
ncbi:MAG TPA: glycosyltransferase family 2 protein [Longimicrobiales bacterium]|nr:glycosyltransferase family 2 protein [Longimicrobiales bacterium]